MTDDKPTNEQFCILIKSESLLKKEKAHRHSLFNLLKIFLCASLNYHVPKAHRSLHMTICLPLIPNEPICWRFSRRSWSPYLKYWALLSHFLARPTLPRWQWPKQHCVNFTAWNVTLVVRTSKQESHSAVQENEKSYMNIKVLYIISLIWRVVVRRMCLLLCPMEEKSQRLLLAVALAVKSFISHCSAKAG